MAVGVAGQEQAHRRSGVRGFAAALRWRARAIARQNCVFQHLLDGMVNIRALAKRRSSSRQLNKVARAFSILELATGTRAVFGFTSSAESPADAPSRLRDG